MAAFVKSVERFSISLTGGGTLTNTADLTKDQDLSKTVAFCTARSHGASSADYRTNNMYAVKVFDDAGTKKVEAKKVTRGTDVADGVCEVMVVEFGQNVTVQKGEDLFLGGTSVTQTITSVNQGNAFVLFSYYGTGDGFDHFNDAMVLAKFNSNTELQFQRTAAGTPDAYIHWAVVESNGTDFQTEYVTFSPAASATGPTNVTLSNSVTLANSFIVPSYESSETSDDLRDACFNMALTGSTTLTYYRNHGGTPAAAASMGVWVVRSNSSGCAVQRFATDVDGQTTTDQTISAVDLDKAVIFSGHHIGIGDWPITSTTSGTNVEAFQTSIALTSTTNVRTQRRQTFSVAGSNNFVRYEVVEFELESTGPGPQTIPVSLVEETDSVLDVTPIGGAVSVPVDLVEETDSVFPVTPVTGGPPQTVPVDLVSESDSVLEVKPVAGAVSVPVGIVSETDTVLPVTPVEGPVSVAVGVVEEINQIAPVFPVLEGGPQTVLVVNVAEIDVVFPVTPRLPSDEVPGGIPTKPRKRSRKKRRYILPDNRVFTDPERALYELRELLKAEQQAARQESGGGLAVSSTSDASLGQETSPPDTTESEPVTPAMLELALTELPELLLARPEAVPSLDPQLISVLFQMIDDEEAAMLLL